MIIDFHVHAFPVQLAERAVGGLAEIAHIAPNTDGTVADTIEKLKQYHIDKAVFMNIATKPTQQKTINRWIYQLSQRFNCMIPFGTVHPDSPTALDELDWLKEKGFHGIKLHPDHQHFMIDDKRAFPIYQKCSDLGLIITFHAGFDPISPNLMHASPQRIARVIEQFSNFKIVLAHMGGELVWDDVETYLVGKNVYFDTSLVSGTGMQLAQAKRIILNHGTDRILFGTDSPWDRADRAISFIKAMQLGKEIEDKIFYENAQKLLNL